MSQRSAKESMGRLREAASFLKERVREKPSLGFILGSGLSFFADTLSEPQVFAYGDIPHFPTSSVEGHPGRLVIGKHGGVPVAVLQGRVHYYEGYSMEEVVFPLRVLGLIGVSTVFITNAAGAVNPAFKPGDLMAVTDHVNLMGANPLRGQNMQELGPRFFDMGAAYDSKLNELLVESAKKAKLKLHEGVYAALPGPSYETPAEIAMLKKLGADAVGMSTVPEVLAARHMGMRVCALSCLTNKAAAREGSVITHQEVTRVVNSVKSDFLKLVEAWIQRFAEEGSHEKKRAR